MLSSCSHGDRPTSSRRAQSSLAVRTGRGFRVWLCVQGEGGTRRGKRKAAGGTQADDAPEELWGRRPAKTSGAALLLDDQPYGMIASAFLLRHASTSTQKLS